MRDVTTVGKVLSWDDGYQPTPLAPEEYPDPIGEALLESGWIDVEVE